MYFQNSYINWYVDMSDLKMSPFIWEWQKGKIF